MSKTFLATLAAAFGLWTLASAAPLPSPSPTLQGKKAAKKQDESKTKVKYAVVKVGDGYRVLAAKEIPALKKKLAADHKRAVRQHADRKKRAARNKEKLREPKPKKERLKIVTSSLPSKEAAEAYVAKIREKETKGKGGKRQPPARGGKEKKEKGDDGKGRP